MMIHHSWSPNQLICPPQISEFIFVGNLWHHRIMDGLKNTNIIQIWMYVLKFGSSIIRFWCNLAPQIMKKEMIRFPSPHIDCWLFLHKKGAVNWIMTQRAVEPSALITYAWYISTLTAGIHLRVSQCQWQSQTMIIIKCIDQARSSGPWQSLVCQWVYWSLNFWHIVAHPSLPIIGFIRTSQTSCSCRAWTWVTAKLESFGVGEGSCLAGWGEQQARGWQVHTNTSPSIDRH